MVSPDGLEEVTMVTRDGLEEVAMVTWDRLEHAIRDSLQRSNTVFTNRPSLPSGRHHIINAIIYICVYLFTHSDI